VASEFDPKADAPIRSLVRVAARFLRAVRHRFLRMFCRFDTANKRHEAERAAGYSAVVSQFNIGTPV